MNKTSPRALVNNAIKEAIKSSKYTAREVYDVIVNSDFKEMEEILNNRHLPAGLRIALSYFLKNREELEAIRLYFDALNKLETLEHNRDYNRLKYKMLEKQIEKIDDMSPDIMPDVNFIFQ